MAGRIVAKKAVTRRKGFLYFVDGQGNVRETAMARGGKRKKKSSARKSSSRRSTGRRSASRRRR